MSKEKLIPEFRFPEFKGEWSLEELGQCLDYLQPTPFLVDNTDYNDEYEIPVLTAGKSFILGYTNEQEGIFNENLPVIIFDDFTTASQFVDFPFKTKSSAMKILLAKNGNDIKFVYESMQTLNYEVGVHKRHWISVFSKLRIAVPKPQEQQKIASCLSSLDELIAAYKDKLDALKDHKKGLLQNLFPQEGETVPKVRFPEFEEDGEWVEKKLGDAADFINGRAYKKEELLTSGKYRVLRVGNFFTNKEWYYSDLELGEDKYCDNGDLLYAWSASFGPRIWKEEKVIYHYHIWKVVEKSGIDKQFLFVLLDFETENIKVAQARGLGMQHLTKSGIETWESRIPQTKEEQQKIASCLSAADELITAQQDKIEQLQKHKKGLMQGLFPKIES